jgi:predicted transposase YbfD/YdcC
MTAADVNRHIRSHWGIENKSHYVRDTVYREGCGSREGRTFRAGLLCGAGLGLLVAAVVVA